MPSLPLGSRGPRAAAVPAPAPPRYVPRPHPSQRFAVCDATPTARLRVELAHAGTRAWLRFQSISSNVGHELPIDPAGDLHAQLPAGEYEIVGMRMEEDDCSTASVMIDGPLIHVPAHGCTNAGQIRVELLRLPPGNVHWQRARARELGVSEASIFFDPEGGIAIRSVSLSREGPEQCDLTDLCAGYDREAPPPVRP